MRQEKQLSHQGIYFFFDVDSSAAEDLVSSWIPYFMESLLIYSFLPDFGSWLFFTYDMMINAGTT